MRKNRRWPISKFTHGQRVPSGEPETSNQAAVWVQRGFGCAAAVHLSAAVIHKRQRVSRRTALRNTRLLKCENFQVNDTPHGSYRPRQGGSWHWCVYFYIDSGDREAASDQHALEKRASNHICNNLQIKNRCCQVYNVCTPRCNVLACTFRYTS